MLPSSQHPETSPSPQPSEMIPSHELHSIVVAWLANVNPDSPENGAAESAVNSEAGDTDSEANSVIERSREPDDLVQPMRQMLLEIQQLEIKVSKLEQEAEKTKSSLEAVTKLALLNQLNSAYLYLGHV